MGFDIFGLKLPTTVDDLRQLQQQLAAERDRARQRQDRERQDEIARLQTQLNARKIALQEAMRNNLPSARVLREEVNALVDQLTALQREAAPESEAVARLSVLEQMVAMLRERDSGSPLLPQLLEQLQQFKEAMLASPEVPVHRRPGALTENKDVAVAQGLEVSELGVAVSPEVKRFLDSILRDGSDFTGPVQTTARTVQVTPEVARTFAEEVAQELLGHPLNDAFFGAPEGSLAPAHGEATPVMLSREALISMSTNALMTAGGDVEQAKRLMAQALFQRPEAANFVVSQLRNLVNQAVAAKLLPPAAAEKFERIAPTLVTQIPTMVADILKRNPQAGRNELLAGLFERIGQTPQQRPTLAGFQPRKAQLLAAHRLMPTRA